MIKAVFIDYTGTIVQEGGSEMKEVVRRVCSHSTLQDPQKLMEKWWNMLGQFEGESFGLSYRTEDEIVEKALQVLVTEYGLREDTERLHELIQGFWVNAPVFLEVPDFFDKCPVPIYIISNNGSSYIEAAMALNHLAPAGIVCADMVKAYKPHHELFEMALKVSGCSADEVVHIGDSIESDVKGASAVGIKPILIDRTGKHDNPDIFNVKSLTEVLDWLRLS